MIKIETGNEYVDDFVAHVDKKLKAARHNLKLFVGQDLYIGGSKVEGYYSEPDKELAVVVDKTDWVSTLAHEFNHFLQKQNNSKKWKDLDFDDKNAYELFWDWIDKSIELDTNTVERVVRKIQDVEHECECNTIEMIKEYNLPVNLEEYVLSSNSYLLFFQYAKKYRVWYSETGSTRNEYLFSRLPKTKMVDDYYHLPLAFEPYFKMNT